MQETIKHESFNISFKGPSLDTHEILVDVLANSLLSLKDLSQRIGRNIHGKDTRCDMKVVGGFKSGSFCVDLVVEYAAPIIGAIPNILTVVVGTIQLFLWAKGNPFKHTEKVSNTETKVTNYLGEKTIINNLVVNNYNNKSVKSNLDLFTSPLDFDGVDVIEIGSENEEIAKAVIEKTERVIFKTGDETVLSDDTNETEVYIVAALFNGTGKGWRFSDDNGDEYSASIEDIEFLNSVKNGEYSIKNGDSLIVDIQTVRRKKARKIITDRIILQVKEYISK